jgi:hypothetical protein
MWMLIAEISSYAAYADFSERLRRCGFREDTSEGAPICRWRQKKTILEVMPLDEKILGFSNRWYKPALDSSLVHKLGPDLPVRVVTGVYFSATKLEHLLVEVRVIINRVTILKIYWPWWTDEPN